MRAFVCTTRLSLFVPPLPPCPLIPLAPARAHSYHPLRTPPVHTPPVRTPPLPRGCSSPWARSYAPPGALAFALVCICVHSRALVCARSYAPPGALASALVCVWAGLGLGRARLCSRVLACAREWVPFACIRARSCGLVHTPRRAHLHSRSFAFACICVRSCALVLVWAGLGLGRARLCSRALVSGSRLGEVGAGSVVCG
jgi:hypothetical protein